MVAKEPQFNDYYKERKGTLAERHLDSCDENFKQAALEYLSTEGAEDFKQEALRYLSTEGAEDPGAHSSKDLQSAGPDKERWLKFLPKSVSIKNSTGSRIQVYVMNQSQESRLQRLTLGGGAGADGLSLQCALDLMLRDRLLQAAALNHGQVAPFHLNRGDGRALITAAKADNSKEVFCFQKVLKLGKLGEVTGPSLQDDFLSRTPLNLAA